MGHVICYIAATADGFIADAKGGLDFLPKVDPESYKFEDFLSTIQQTWMGRKTYEEVLGFEGPFAYRNQINHVFSGSFAPAHHPHAHWHQGDAVEIMKKLKEETTGNIWLVGGGTLNGAAWKAGLIDTLELYTVPVWLGTGKPLFGGITDGPAWELVSAEKSVGEMTRTVYRARP